GGAGQIAVFLQLALEALEERESISRSAGEARDHLVVVELAHLARVALHDGVAQSHLAVAGQRHAAVAPHTEDGRAVWIESLRIAHPSSSPKLSRARLRSPRPGVSGVVNAGEVLEVKVGVDLGRGDIGMAQ